MNKLFRPKCMRRVLLCLALLFPIVYLCGGLFFALAGAHGENVLTTDETSIVDYRHVDFNQIINLEINDLPFLDKEDGKIVFNTTYTPTSNAYLHLSENIYFKNHYYIIRTSSNNTEVTNNFRYAQYGVIGTGFSLSSLNENKRVLCSAEGIGRIVLYVGSGYTVAQGTYIQINIFDLTQMYGVGNEPTLDEFNNDFPNSYYDYTLSQFVSFPIYGVPNEQNSLFFHIFGQRNFISQLGKDLVNGTTKGFDPMNDLFRFVNTNIMHFEDTDGLAMFGLGYVYYAVNVLIIYEILILAVKLIMLPLKAVDLFDKKEDI